MPIHQPKIGLVETPAPSIKDQMAMTVYGDHSRSFTYYVTAKPTCHTLRNLATCRENCVNCLVVGKLLTLRSLMVN